MDNDFLYRFLVKLFTFSDTSEETQQLLDAYHIMKQSFLQNLGFLAISGFALGIYLTNVYFIIKT